MARTNDFTTANYAAHVVQFDQARLMSWDDRISKLKACVLAAKQRQALGFDETAKLATLREQFTALCDELEAVEETVVTVVLDDLTAAADQVRSEAAPEWKKALDFGWSWLLEQDIFRVDAYGSLLIPSSRNASTVYRANGTCQCEAFTKPTGPIPCMHRGAGLIVERWRENVALERAAAYE